MVGAACHTWKAPQYFGSESCKISFGQIQISETRIDVQISIFSHGRSSSKRYRFTTYLPARRIYCLQHFETLPFFDSFWVITTKHNDRILFLSRCGDVDRNDKVRNVALELQLRKETGSGGCRSLLWCYSDEAAISAAESRGCAVNAGKRDVFESWLSLIFLNIEGERWFWDRAPSESDLRLWSLVCGIISQSLALSCSRLVFLLVRCTALLTGPWE